MFQENLYTFTDGKEDIIQSIIIRYYFLLLTNKKIPKYQYLSTPVRYKRLRRLHKSEV